MPVARGPCGKLDFPTKAAAEAELRRCITKRRRGQRHRNEHSIYFCGMCLGWHLTHRLTRTPFALTDHLISLWRITP